MTSTLRVLPDAVAVTGRDARNRASGTAATLARAASRERVDDVVLEERVRSALGRAAGHSGAVAIQASDGRVTLSGAVLTSEADGIVAAARRVPGVREVEDHLDRHDEPGHIPDLQGAARQPESRPDFLQRRWAPATRLVALVAGGAAALSGLRTRGPIGLVGAAAGALVAVRGLTNLELGRILGVAGGRRGVDVQKAIDVLAPADSAFALWDRFEEFPRFMSHVKRVDRLGGDRSRWTVAGPGGVPLEFEAVVTRRVPGEVLAWKSVDGEPIGHAGIVRFEPRGEGRTRITVRMTYNPPAGLLAHAVASLSGADPKQALDDDLVRFKSLLEEGKATGDGRQAHLADVLPEAEPMRSG